MLASTTPAWGAMPMHAMYERGMALAETLGAQFQTNLRYDLSTYCGAQETATAHGFGESVLQELRATATARLQWQRAWLIWG